MAMDYRQSNKVMKSHRKEEAPGTRVDPHPYIGIVKNNLDPTRSGRLQVWIPDLGGLQDEPKNWRTVGYASPFMGTTNIKQESANRVANTDNKFTNTPHTYGMWMVPPDIGVEVICIFIAGDPLRGYWLACVNSHLSKHMIPGIASSTNVDISGASADVKKSYKPGNPAPVTEFNENNPDTYQQPGWYSNPKPIHEPQYQILKTQGLDRDTVRGLVTSSSQRETPSNVFGISTPGRPYPDAGVNDPEGFKAKIAAGTLTESDYAYTTRKGGHTFIMDDGNVVGKDQLIRLRTSQGHQIMMHDEQNTLYISHADGTSWVELTDNGSINIFSAAGFNVRSQGTINLHSDKDVNINASRNINLSAGSGFQLNSSSVAVVSGGAITVAATGIIGFQSDAALNVDAVGSISLKTGTFTSTSSMTKINSGSGQPVKKPKNIQVNQLSDVVFDSSTGLHVAASKLSSIVTVAPSHEPYNRGEQYITAKEDVTGIKPATAYTEATDSIKRVSGTSVPSPAGEQELRDQPACDCQVGNLSSDQLTAFFTQVGKSESGGFNKNKFPDQYHVVNTIGYVGKYQFGYLALIDAGYVSRSCKSNAQLNNPNSWSPNKNGVDSLEKWLASPGLQESAMCDNTKRNYTAMCKNGAITKDMPPEDVAGMLAVAHLLGAGGANSWRKGSGKADAYGTTGDTYFQKGKYAVAVLAPKVATVSQG